MKIVLFLMLYIFILLYRDKVFSSTSFWGPGTYWGWQKIVFKKNEKAFINITTESCFNMQLNQRKICLFIFNSLGMIVFLPWNCKGYIQLQWGENWIGSFDWKLMFKVKRKELGQCRGSRNKWKVKTVRDQRRGTQL